MPSADFYQLIPPPLDDSSTEANWQTSPGNAHPPSRLCPPHIRPCFPYRYWTLKICAFSSSTPASYAISVRRASALPAASFRSHLTVDTLAVRLTIPPVGFVENFHLQVGAPCRAHTKKESGSPRSLSFPTWPRFSCDRICPSTGEFFIQNRQGRIIDCGADAGELRSPVAVPDGF